DSCRTRLPDSCTAFRLTQGECCCHEPEATFRCTGAEANAASAAGAEGTRNLCPFAGKPRTPAPCETVCCARAGVGRCCWRRGSLRNLYPSRRAAGRVPPSGRGHWSKWFTRRHRGTGAGACGDAAQRANLRTSDYAASTGCNQRWQAPSPGDEGLVSRNSWTAGIGPVGKRQKPSRYCIAQVLLARRRRSNHPKTISRGGSRHHKGSELRWMFALSLFQSAQGRNSHWIVVCRRSWRERSGNEMQGRLKHCARVTLRQSSRRSWRIGQRRPVEVKFFAYIGTMQEVCLRLMGKRLLVALAMEGKFASEGLQAVDGDDDMLTAMARELVENKGIGESADSIWRNVQQLRPSTSAAAAQEPEEWPILQSEISVPAMLPLPIESLPGRVTD